MNTKKMIADIKSVCEELETRKKELLAQVQTIDGQLASYYMAAEALDKTLPSVEKPVESYVCARNTNKIGHKTVLEFGGKKQTVVQWAKEMDISADGIVYRLNNGWPVSDALTKRKMQGKSLEKRKPKKVFAYDQHGNIVRQYVSVGEASRSLNIPKNVVEKLLSDVSVADQLSSRSFYLAYAS